MAQPSEWKTGKYSEWYTELPTVSTPRESPTFLIQDKECYFRFSRFDGSLFCEDDCYHLYLNKKEPNLKLEPFTLTLMVYDCNLSAAVSFQTTFQHSHSSLIYSCNVRDFRNRIVSSSEGDFVRFLFMIENTNTEDPSSLSEGKMDVHLKALSRDISKLIDDSYGSDVKIQCEDRTFHAHRIVLGMRSTVLSAMLQSKMVEDETGLIKVEDFSASIFQGFLHYLYSGTLPKFEIDTATQFYEIADKYAVEELKMACSEFLKENLSESNACAILVLAHQHSDLDFRKSVISYIIEKDIPRREKEWDDFCENHCKLANEVYKLYIQRKVR